MTTAVIAFSGGLDTSFLVPFVREKYGFSRVITCTVNTGGFTADDRETIARRAAEVGSDEHLFLEASEAYYDEIIKYLIFGNVTRDGYPLCVGAERLIQARAALEVCIQKNVSHLVHGSTGAGNDQYRFDLVAYVLGQGADGRAAIKPVAPIREHGIKREFSQNYLRGKNISVADKSDYSYNAGLWGVSIGGKETLKSDGIIPENAWYTPMKPGAERAECEITFEHGELAALKIGTGKTIHNPIEIIQTLARVAGEMGIGRHYHIGTAIPGKKGRLAYESPAADVIYEAHRTLEKLTLTQSQIFFKKMIADEFGKLIHEAKFFDPLMDDLRAFLQSSQDMVSGVCTVRLLPGRIDSVAVQTEFDLLASVGSLYGEYSEAYTGADAAGSSLLHAYEQTLYQRLRQSAANKTKPAKTA